MIENLINKYQEVAPKGIISAIKSAAEKTGTDFEFLMEKAQAESGFNTNAKASTSSASGLFQFIDSTWLSMVKKYGDKYGLSEYASQIENQNGKLCVTDCAAKEAILNLRNDPEISSLMAAEFTEENKTYLEKNTSGEVGSTELYLAHFMGAKGAAEFLNKRSAEGEEIASSVFTKEARANKNVFFNSNTGEARTLDEVYDFFDKKFTSTTDTLIDSDTESTSGSTINNENEQNRQQGNTTQVAYLTHTHAISSAAAPVHSHTPHPHTPFAQAPSFLDFAGITDSSDAMKYASQIYAQNFMLMAQNSLQGAFIS